MPFIQASKEAKSMRIVVEWDLISTNQLGMVVHTYNLSNAGDTGRSIIV
jgi:hypothetical protein